MTNAKPAAADHVRRSNTNRAAFVVGLPLAAALLAFIHFGPLHGSVVYRYVEHSAECVEVVLFCCALATLGAKMKDTVRERQALATAVVPPWDGRPIPVTEAPALLTAQERVPARLRNTYVVQRVTGVLDFLCQRRSAAELDDHLRTLVDTDSITLENSYALTRFITWAIPILGFLGTVLGITTAISGVKSDNLELGSVTGGLAYAFDATALGLALTMVTMFCSFLVERREQGILESVDRYVEQQLAHRFTRAGVDSGPFTEAVRQNTQVLLQMVGQLVQRQADVWANTFAETQRRLAEAGDRPQERIAAALDAALERTLLTHTQRLAALEKQAVEHSGRLVEQVGQLAAAVRDTGREQQTALVRVGEGLASQAGVLARLQEGEHELLRLQGTLNQNLHALAGAGTFDEAVHSLTAAIHLLTARAGPLTLGRAAEAAAPPRLHPGKAA